MGKLNFGYLAYARGVIKYSLSPMEQKAFADAFREGFPNSVRRFGESVFKVVPPLVVGYLVYDYGERESNQRARDEAKYPGKF